MTFLGFQLILGTKVTCGRDTSCRIVEVKRLRKTAIAHRFNCEDLSGEDKEKSEWKHMSNAHPIYSIIK